MSEIPEDFALECRKKNHETCKIFVKVKLKVKTTYFARCLLAPFSPRFPIFKQSLKGIWVKWRENITKGSEDEARAHAVRNANTFTLMMGWEIASGSKITDFEHIFKEPLVFLGAKRKRII